MVQQQQQYIQYTTQPTSSYPGATVYAYPGSQPVQVIQLQPRVVNPVTLPIKYNQDGIRAAIVLGTIHIIIGCACMCLQSVSLSLEIKLGRGYTLEFVGTGIWCGTMFLVTGILGICSSKKNTPKLVIAFMAFNIVSMFGVITLLRFVAPDLDWIRRCQHGGIGRSSWQSSYVLTCTDQLYSVWAAMDGLMVALAVIELIVAVTSSVYTWKAVCCDRRRNVIQQPLTSGHLPTTTSQLQVLQQRQLQQQQQLLILQQQLPAEVQRLPGAPYAVTGYPQVADGGMVTIATYPHDQSMFPAQPLYPAAPSAPEAQSASPDMKADCSPPDYDTAVRFKEV